MRRLLLTSLASLLLVGCSSSQETAPKEAPPIPVLAAPPALRDVPVFIESIGILRPSILMEVRPEVSGTLSHVMVTEGMTVKKGDPLFKINALPYALKVMEMEAAVATDRELFESAKKKLERYRALAEKDYISQAEWDNLEAELSRAKALLKANTARLKGAKRDCEHCVIAAPLGGRIGRLDAYPGQLISAGQIPPLATISQMDPLTVEFTVTEKEFASLPEGKTEITLYPLSIPHSSFKGQITFFDNHFDPATGQLLVRGKVENPEIALRPGQSVRVLIPVSIMLKSLLIPEKAVKHSEDTPYVYVIQEDGTVGFRQVTLGEEFGGEVVVTDGLNLFEPVITDGHLRLSPGIKVRVP